MSADRLVVGTLNIWNRSGPWPDRCELIRAELGRLQPGVLGLQEVLRLEGQEPSAASCQAHELARGLDYEVAYGRAADFGSGLSFGNAMLSRFPILESRCEQLPGAESGETRSLLYCRVRHPQGELPVFVTHLNWKLHHGSVRVRQVQHLVQRVFEWAPTRAQALPPVLLGDFNAEPESDEMRYLRGHATLDGKSVYFADAWVYGTSGPGYTFDRTNEFAALAHEPPRRIDYIYVRGPDRRFRGEPLATRLAFSEPAETPNGPVWPSDHYGVITELMLAPRDS